MRILAFDSTAVSASVAVTQDTKLVAESTANNGLTHSEILLPMAEAILKSAKLEIDDIDLFACTAGPGSFTGVRIGVATVKGLAFGTGKPCVGVSTLESLAQNLMPLDGIYCPVMDARRGQVYNALFEQKDGVLTRLTPDRALSLAELATELKSRYAGRVIRLSGDGYDLTRAAFAEYGIFSPETPQGLRLQSGLSTALCALRAYARGEAVKDVELTPVYLRLPQAERDRLAAKNAEKETKK